MNVFSSIPVKSYIRKIICINMFNKLRRAKSFNVKNAKPAELSLPESQHLARRTMISPLQPVQLGQSESQAMPSQPRLILVIEKHPQFQKQVEKHNLEKRKSRSLNDVVWGVRDTSDKLDSSTKNLLVPTLSNKSASDLELSKQDNPNNNKIYDDVIRELRRKSRKSREYTSLEKINEEKSIHPPPFPVHDNSVELRHHNEPQSGDKNRSQTIHIGHNTKHIRAPPKNTEIKGAVKIVIEGTTTKISKNQKLFIEQGCLVVVKDDEKDTILKDVVIVKPKSNNKKEITLAQEDEQTCRTYKIQFDNTKDTNAAKDELEKCLPELRKRSSSFNENVSSPRQEMQTKRSMLQKLLGRRSSKDLLEKKGIIKNEPIFGNTLTYLYNKYKYAVPRFVSEATALIESPQNIKSEGLYRASGNLATIQKIRFCIDKNNWRILEQFKNESDVLTGALKLFFRELKEPLLPHSVYENVSRYIDKEITEKAKQNIKNTINKLATAHKETCLFLFRHLLKVELYKTENRMDAYNLSIVWGPTLMWPSENCLDIVESHTNANKVLEILLNTYRNHFVDQLPVHDTKQPIFNTQKQEDDNESKLDFSKTVAKAEFGSTVNNLKKTFSMENLFKITAKELSLSGSVKETKYDLEQLCSNTKEKVPELLTNIIPLIEKNIETEHIYRISPSKEKLEKIFKKMNRNKFNSLDKCNIHELACMLKSFFSELKVPLIPRENFNRLMLIIGETSTKTNEAVKRPNRTQKIKQEIDTLSSAHKSTVEYLFKHLVNVAHHEQANKMSKKYIASIWAMTLFHSFMENSMSTDKKYTDTYIEVVENLLDVYDENDKIQEVVRQWQSKIIRRTNIPRAKLRPILQNSSSQHPDKYLPVATYSLYDNVKNEGNFLDMESARNCVNDDINL